MKHSVRINPRKSAVKNCLAVFAEPPVTSLHKEEKDWAFQSLVKNIRDPKQFGKLAIFKNCEKNRGHRSIPTLNRDITSFRSIFRRRQRESDFFKTTIWRCQNKGLARPSNRSINGSDITLPLGPLMKRNMRL